MTTKQSLTRKQSLIRRSVAVLSAALLAVAWAVGISIPASAAPAKGSRHRVGHEYGQSWSWFTRPRQEFAVEVRVVNNFRSANDSERRNQDRLDGVCWRSWAGGATQLRSLHQAAPAQPSRS
jgi:hypothetical protein